MHVDDLIPNPARLFEENQRLRQAVERYQTTLRDQFAVAALQGILAAPEGNCRPPNEYVADFAYVMADAMLKAREER